MNQGQNTKQINNNKKGSKNNNNNNNGDKNGLDFLGE